MRDLEDFLMNAVAVVRRFGAKRMLRFGSGMDNPAAANDLDLTMLHGSSA